MTERREIRVVECSGNYYEIGKEYGEACKENILNSLEISIGGLRQTYNASREQIVENARKFLPMVEDFAPELIEMLKGQSESVGVSFDDIFAMKCMVELAVYYNQITALCTSFAVTGKATKNGMTFIGQNIDWAPGVPVDLLRIRHDNGLKRLTLVMGGVAEWTLNSTGIGIAKNVILSPPADQRLHIPCSFVGPKAMMQKSMGDALRVLCEASRGVNCHVLASSEGDIICVESTSDDFNVLQPEDGVLVHSNHYLTERFKKADWGYLSTPDTYLRVQRISKLIKEYYGNLSVEILMEILGDHNNYPNSICRHIDEDTSREFYYETLASIIMVPEERIMYVACGQPCRYEYVTYKL